MQRKATLWKGVRAFALVGGVVVAAISVFWIIIGDDWVRFKDPHSSRIEVAFRGPDNRYL
ncbi:MAG: hypothetical protein ACE5LG_10585 [Anaerolineae bacterium]